MKMRLGNVAVSLIGSMLPRVLSVALLTSISNAASLQPSETTENPLDLEVITVDTRPPQPLTHQLPQTIRY